MPPDIIIPHNMYLSGKLININRGLQSHKGLLLRPDIMWHGQACCLDNTALSVFLLHSTDEHSDNNPKL